MTLRQKLACVGLAVFGLQIASAAAGGAPLRDRLQRWFDPEQLLLASVRMELGAPPVAVSPTPEAAAALSAASPAPEVTPVPTADDDVETAPTATADGLPIVATSIAGGLTVKNETDIPVSVAALLQQGPATVLPAGEPQILIMHTHASEAFTPAGHDLYAASDTCRTEDTNYNIVHVGDVLADTLTNAGLEVLHDRTIYDYPSYTGSYSRSGAAVQEYLSQYPSLRIVIDLLRQCGLQDRGRAPGCRVRAGDAARGHERVGALSPALGGESASGGIPAGCGRAGASDAHAADHACERALQPASHARLAHHRGRQQRQHASGGRARRAVVR